MKTSILKTSLVLAISAIALCSFTNMNKTEPPSKVNTTNLSEDEEWSKVYDFINTKICAEIRKASPKKSVKAMDFSRCPSGIHSEMTNEESANSNELVTGQSRIMMDVAENTCVILKCVSINKLQWLRTKIKKNMLQFRIG